VIFYIELNPIFTYFFLYTKW